MTAEGSGASYKVAFDKEAAKVTVNDSRGQKLSFEILPLLERLSLEYPGRHDKETRALMTLEMITGTLRARLRFESLHGEVANGVRRVTYASGTILLGHTEAPE